VQVGGEALEAVQQRCSEAVDVAQLYDGFRRAGLQYEGAFCGVAQLWRGASEAVGWIELAAGHQQEAGDYQIHPALLDS
jgi:acyl transferase domain-containing protein